MRLWQHTDLQERDNNLKKEHDPNKNYYLSENQLNFFIAKKMEGRKESSDAMFVYFTYMRACKKQKTNRPWATNTYIQRGAGIGKEKVKKCIKFLKEFNMIEHIQSKKEDGTFGKTYTQVNFISYTGKIVPYEAYKEEKNDKKNNLSGSPETGLPVNKSQVLKKEKKMLKKENKYIGESGDSPTTNSNFKFNREIEEVLSLWNKCGYTAKHKKGTKTHDKIKKYYAALRNGIFTEYCTNINTKFLNQNNIPIKKQYTHVEILQGIKNYFLQFEPGYWPYDQADKDRLTKSLLIFLYNPRSTLCPSIFLKLMHNKPEKKDTVTTLVDDKHPEVTAEYLRLLGYRKRMPTTEEQNKLIYKVSRILKKREMIVTAKYKTKYGDRTRLQLENGNFMAYMGSKNNPNNFIAQHIEFIKSLSDFIPDFKFNLGCLNTTGKIWKLFEKKYSADHLINFVLTENQEKILVSDYEGRIFREQELPNLTDEEIKQRNKKTFAKIGNPENYLGIVDMDEETEKRARENLKNDPEAQKFILPVF